MTATETFGTGKFTFTVTKAASIPEPVKPAPKVPQGLPFKDWFETAEHADHIFVPSSFWTAPKEEGGRGANVAADKVNAYARNKIREQFNTWRDKAKPADGGANPRDACKLSIFPRRAGDRMDGASPPFAEDGLSLFFVQSAGTGAL
ncbi:hypothetical protein [Methylobacterium marchantiae]|uniref:Uncharacterized protein n=1 Tax=Methylobacterium marchantiae TaxID=600331 RepID=A0ABW3X4F0_9HYPH|nr:hypothetical protein AIGOOFII_3466 [Methylobacterium marchantiae]